MKTLRYFFALGVLLCATSAWASKSAGWSMGLNLGFINSDQKDFNKEIDARTGATGVKDFGNAWEFNGHLTYRLASSSVALALRPSYFMHEEEDGTGASYNLTGFTVFPMLKYYMLENQSIKFYSQFGVGYGRLMGEIKDDGFEVEFSGGNIGYMAGLGAEFCFFNSHCVNVEGGLRFLSVDRFIVDKSSGSIPSGSRIDQANKDGEFEIDGRDFSATMSGILGMVGYTLYF